jgi:predicted phosphodiesterase
MSKLDKVLFIPDCHIPYEDAKAFNLMLEVAYDWKPHTVVILGDFADFYSVSNFSKSTKRRGDLEWEVDAVNSALDAVDMIHPKLKVFVEGNHEHRLNRYVQDHARALDGLVGVKKDFRLTERGWIYTPYRDHYKLGKVYLTHDVGATGRNAVHKIIDTYQHSAITGHTHRISYAVEADGLGEPILSATFGWLGDITKVDYAHKIVATKAYVLGFGIGYIERSTGIVFATPVPIINNRCMVEGRLYRG